MMGWIRGSNDSEPAGQRLWHPVSLRHRNMIIVELIWSSLWNLWDMMLGFWGAIPSVGQSVCFRSSKHANRAWAIFLGDCPDMVLEAWDTSWIRIHLGCGGSLIGCKLPDANLQPARYTHIHVPALVLHFISYGDGPSDHIWVSSLLLSFLFFKSISFFVQVKCWDFHFGLGPLWKWCQKRTQRGSKKQQCRQKKERRRASKRASTQGRKQGSKQASKAHLWIWCAAGGALPPPNPVRGNSTYNVILMIFDRFVCFNVLIQYWNC